MSDEQGTARRCDALLGQLDLTDAVRFSERYPDVTCWLAPDAFAQLFLKHPKGLDALEAALLVLADEARIPLTADQVTRDALESCRRDRDALTKRIREERAAMDQLIARSSVGAGVRAMQDDPEAELQRLDDELTPDVMEQIMAWNAEPPAWVEKLASEWEARADRLGDIKGMATIATAHEAARCAAELRERVLAEPIAWLEADALIREAQHLEQLCRTSVQRGDMTRARALAEQAAELRERAKDKP